MGGTPAWLRATGTKPQEKEKVRILTGMTRDSLHGCGSRLSRASVLPRCQRKLRSPEGLTGAAGYLPGLGLALGRGPGASPQASPGAAECPRDMGPTFPPARDPGEQETRVGATVLSSPGIRGCTSSLPLPSVT